MKIISADHSGSIVDFQALVTREEAERLARDVKESFEVAGESWGSPPELKCVDGQSPDNFLAGDEEMECTYDGERTNFYSIRPSGYKDGGNELYNIEGSYEDEDQPTSFSPDNSIIYIGTDGNVCIIELRGNKLDIDDLAGRLL